MEKNPLVSVIVPVYKVEAYISECISSLIKQTYSNLEIILVDDESPDLCPAICEKYAAEDSRIKVIHKKNGGAASARNVALDVAKGEYICFVDADDYVLPDYVRILLKKISQENAQISCCSFSYIYKDMSEREEMITVTPRTLTQTEYLALFMEDWRCGLIWNKLFQRSVIEKIRFPEGHRIDDEFFTYKVVMNAKKLALCSESLYRYRMRTSSVMSGNSQYMEKTYEDKLEYLHERFADVTSMYPELYLKYLAGIAESFIQLWYACNGNRDLEKLVLRTASNYTRDILKKSISWSLKKAYVLAIVFQHRQKTKPFARKTDNYFD